MLPSSFGEVILPIAEVVVDIAVGLGILDPLLRGEVGDVGGSVFDASTVVGPPS